MLRGDLRAAGIPYAVEGPDGPLFADFHALRHTYLTLLGRGGVDLRTAQELAGHSTPLLTARYTHRRMYDLAGAVEKLPNFLPGTDAKNAEQIPVKATGTHGQHAANHVGNPDMPAHQPGIVRTDGGERRELADRRKYQENEPVSTPGHRPALVCISEGDGTRTRNHRIDRQIKLSVPSNGTTY